MTDHEALRTPGVFHQIGEVWTAEQRAREGLTYSELRREDPVFSETVRNWPMNAPQIDLGSLVNLADGAYEIHMMLLDESMRNVAVVDFWRWAQENVPAMGVPTRVPNQILGIGNLKFQGGIANRTYQELLEELPEFCVRILKQQDHIEPQWLRFQAWLWQNMPARMRLVVAQSAPQPRRVTGREGVPDGKLEMGQHAGEWFSEILRTDPQYCQRVQARVLANRSLEHPSFVQLSEYAAHLLPDL